MGERLTDDEWRAAAASRPGYATYPDYRPGQPERLGRLPSLLPPPPACSHGYVTHVTLGGATVHPDGVACSNPAPWSSCVTVPVVEQPADRPPLIVKVKGHITDEEVARIKDALLVTVDDQRPSVPAKGPTLDARPPTTDTEPPPATLAELPPAPVFDFQPRWIVERPWWRRRWHWAVMAAGGVRHGYAWTEGGARRRTARVARRAARRD